jgi:ribonuclease T
MFVQQSNAHPMYQPGKAYRLNERFRGYLPVVVDVETGGFNEKTDALLEIAAVLLDFDETGKLHPVKSLTTHVVPFDGSNIDPKSLEVNGIDPYHPLRAAREEREALSHIFKPVRDAVSDAGCTRAILVGHNAFFDLKFVNAAADRTGIKKNPFHPFSCFDTVSLCGLAFGQTVLARAAVAAGMNWDTAEAHSAIYDTRITAELFCTVVNRWESLHDGVDAPIADGSVLPR